MTSLGPTFDARTKKANPDDIGMLLVTFNHADLDEPIRVANTSWDVVSNGLTYTGWPLIPQLPTEGDSAKSGGITIQNVDSRIGETLKGLKGNITVLFGYVERENPDSEFFEQGGLFIRNVSFDDIWIHADIVGYGADSQPWPKAAVTPDAYPGVFS